MEFQTWLKSNAELKTISLDGNLGILQVFLRFCANIDAVPKDLVERVPLPTVPDDEEIRDDARDDSFVEKIRTYLEQFEYASRPHIEFELIAEIGIRLGGVHAIDLAAELAQCHQVLVYIVLVAADRARHLVVIEADGLRGEYLGLFLAEYCLVRRLARPALVAQESALDYLAPGGRESGDDPIGRHGIGVAGVAPDILAIVAKFAVGVTECVGVSRRGQHQRIAS